MPRILVADDNSNIQKMVALAFQERGIEVTSVGNGEAAVRRIPELNPDIVLADVFMPVRNGYEVCEFVKKDQRFAHVPVILLVGAFDPLDEKEARRVGADGVLKKPFVPPDPLIAMVTAALEKNPKVATEGAKPKKSESEAGPVPFELSSAPEPKPLPEYPDPTPEEEAAIYGFGNSARALEDAGLPGSSRAPKGLDEDTFDDEAASETAHKIWRRTAEEFDVPSAEASRPALSADERLDSAMFPSERDVPPRHVRMRDVEPEEEVEAQKPAPAFEQVPSTPAAISVAAVPANAHVEPPATVASDPVVEVPLSVHRDEEPATPPILAVVSSVPLPPEPVKPVAASEVHAEVAAEESKPAVHWMDMMAPLPSAPVSSDWMSALRASAVPEARPDSLAASRLEAPVAVPEAEVVPEAPRAAEELHPESANDAHSSAPVNPPEPKLEASSESQSPTEKQFFDKDLVAAEAPGSDRNLLVVAPDPPVPANLKDPDLDGPVSVRVTPEPLLENEEAQSSTDYNSHPEETAPMHSFEFPAPMPSAQAPSESESHVEEKAAAAESVSAEAPATSETFAPMPEPEPDRFTATWSTSEPNPAEWTERTPTVPPPNRDALAEIPFLTPPPAFQPQAPGAAVDSATVDVVVQKVLERLESQIHGILSQGALKPLVENLLEGELSKKEK